MSETTKGAQDALGHLVLADDFIFYALTAAAIRISAFRAAFSR